MADLSDFIVSKVRVKLLSILLSSAGELFHVRGLVRLAKEEINAVRRELMRMEEAGIVKKEARGNRLYYWARTDYLFYQDLLSAVSKTTGLGGAIYESRNKLGKINFVMLSGRTARGKPRKAEDEVDLLVVGEVVLPELASIVRSQETRLGREINYTVMTKEEFEFRKRRKDSFLAGILSGSRIMIVGDEEDLVS